MKRVLSLALALATTFGVACGDDNKVGDESLLDFKEQTQERLGESTTTTAAPTTTTTAGKGTATTTKPGAGGNGATATTATTTKPTQATATTATTAPQPTFALEIFINGDDSADPPFDPQTGRIYVGSAVRWTNKDKVPRQVVFEGGKIPPSPTIPPGGNWEYKFSIVSPDGDPFRYGDGGRPYVTALLEVLPK